MKLYTFPGAPNPRRVDIFLAEKNLDVPKVKVDMLRGENRKPEFIDEKNIMGSLPVLELDDGSHIAESVAICRYLETLHPETPLFGTDAKSIGQIEMWIRRMELNFMMPVGMIWVHGSPLTKLIIKNQVTEVAEQSKPLVRRFFKTFDKVLANNEFACGVYYSMADIIGLTTYDFAVQMQLVDAPTDLINVSRWYNNVSSRPSAAAK